MTAFKDEGADNTIISQSLAEEINLSYEDYHETYDSVGNTSTEFVGIARDCTIRLGTPEISFRHDIRVATDNRYLMLLVNNVCSGKCVVKH